MFLKRRFLLTHRLIDQPLADCPCQSDFRTLGVIHAKPLAGVLAKVKFGQVAVNVPLGKPTARR